MGYSNYLGSLEERLLSSSLPAAQGRNREWLKRGEWMGLMGSG